MNGINWFSFTAADGYDYGITLPLLCLAAVIVFTAILMNYTRLGRQIYAMGGNRDAASRLGLNLLKLHFYVYGYMVSGRRRRRRAGADHPVRSAKLAARF